MESKADKIVKVMLEDDQQDAHVKAWDRVQKWDKAHGTYQKLYGQHLKARALFRELGKSIGYERALAQIGLGRDEVAQHIHGEQIGATHNYKGTRAAKVCQDKQHCSAGRVSTKQNGEVCSDCGGPLGEVQVRYAPNELRGKYGRYMFGVETKDARLVWFTQPIPPEPEAQEYKPEGA